jgi:hypothetical protein
VRLARLEVLDRDRAERRHPRARVLVVYFLVRSRDGRRRTRTGSSRRLRRSQAERGQQCE